MLSNHTSMQRRWKSITTSTTLPTSPNLNNALANNPELQNKSAEELIKSLSSLPEAIRTAVRNNGGGHVNHSMFWQQLKAGVKEPTSGKLISSINSAFGSTATFKEQFNKAGLGRFGSGWAWLVVGKDKKLAIISTANQDNPLTDGATPILGCDVWEHAYYLKYRTAGQTILLHSGMSSIGRMFPTGLMRLLVNE